MGHYDSTIRKWKSILKFYEEQLEKKHLFPYYDEKLRLKGIEDAKQVIALLEKAQSQHQSDE